MDMAYRILHIQSERLADLLGQAEGYFRPGSNIKLTLIARSTSDADCFMVVTADDDLGEVQNVLAKAAAKDAILVV